MNILLAFVLLFVYLAMIGPRDPARGRGTVDEIQKGFPAAAGAPAGRQADLG